MDSKTLETDSYAHFLYNREIVFGVKYQVRVRIFSHDLVQLRKVSFWIEKNWAFYSSLYLYLASSIGQWQFEQILWCLHGCPPSLWHLEALSAWQFESNDKFILSKKPKKLRYSESDCQRAIRGRPVRHVRPDAWHCQWVDCHPPIICGRPWTAQLRELLDQRPLASQNQRFWLEHDPGESTGA